MKSTHGRRRRREANRKARSNRSKSSNLQYRQHG